MWCLYGFMVGKFEKKWLCDGVLCWIWLWSLLAKSSIKKKNWNTMVLDRIKKKSFIILMRIYCGIWNQKKLSICALMMMNVARQNPCGVGCRSFSAVMLTIRSLESPPSNLLRATRKPDVLVLSEIHG